MINQQFSRGIEIVTAAIIRNTKGEILLVKNSKWKNWIVPGGHVEPGETIGESAEREVKEETGLSAKFVKVIEYAELINIPQFHRKAHFISFYCILDAGDEQIKTPDEREVTEYIWRLPKDALEEALDPGIHDVINKYIASTV